MNQSLIDQMKKDLNAKFNKNNCPNHPFLTVLENFCEYWMKQERKQLKQQLKDRLEYVRWADISKEQAIQDLITYFNLNK